MSSDLRQELEGYVEAGCPGDVNAFLDDRELAHPQIEHEPRDEFVEEANREAKVICEPGYTPVSIWVPDKAGGHLFWYCERV